MAKTKHVIEIDVLSKGLDATIKNFQNLTENTGDMGKKAKEAIKMAEKATSLIKEYGDEMPTNKAKELQKLLKGIANNSKEISRMKEIKVFGDKELERIKKINSQIDDYNNKIKKQAELQKNLAVKRDDKISKLKTQKTAVDPSDSSKRIKLDSVQGKWNNKQDLEKLQQSGDDNQKKAASALLKQYTEIEKSYSDALKESINDIGKYEQKIVDLRAAKQEVAKTTRALTEEERSYAEASKDWATNTSSNVQKVIKSNEALGKTSISTSSKLKQQSASLGGVVKSLFSWAQVWNVGKKLYQEAVKTITEMDQALTGMAMVTGLAKEETEKLIPQIQNLAKETSTAMTEIANLITEYTRQGRSLAESFVLAEETAKAAKIAGISASDSIQYMTSTINGFNMAASEATHVSDVFANVAAISATNYEQLAIALSKVSAQANLAGMSMEYTTALLAKGIEVTQEAPESIGTALKTVIARMRELTDYGKTLEDGVSVNRVENALASAGIGLRTVTGEFKELEDVFNELGPKWDSLNTMQQQAIAQAVAGTRQQSRFVAIMQDWERTQELATESQNSAGASAAQYTVYAQGMEAAITNLKTSWQEFTQSLISSKFIIGIVNAVSKVLTGITNFLENGGEFTKAVFIGLTAIVAINTTLNNLKKVLGMNTNKELEIETQLLRIKQAEKKEEEAKLALKLKQVDAAEQAAKAELDEAEAAVAKKKKSVSAAKGNVTKASNYLKTGEGKQTFTEDDLAKHQETLKIRQEELRLLEEEADKKRKAHKTAQEDSQQAKENYDFAVESRMNAENEYYEAMSTMNSPLAARTQNLIKEYDVKKRNNKLLIEQLKKEKTALENQKDGAKNKDKIAKIDKKIAKYNKENEAYQKRINALEEKKQRILTKTQNIFQAMGDTISTGIESALSGVFDKLGPIGDLLSQGLSSLISWGGNLLADLVLEKSITKEKVKQNASDKQGLVDAALDLGIDKLREETEEDITEEKTKQKSMTMAEKIIQIAKLAIEKLALRHQKKKTREQVVTTTGVIGETVAQAGAQGASQNYAGMAIGIAAAIAALALIGVAATIGISAGMAGGAKQNKAATEKIATQQNTVYTLRKKNKELGSTTSELETLMDKEYKTEEDNSKIAELADNLRGQNEAWEGLNDDQVLEKAKAEISRNTDVISRNIDSNYKLALSLEDLSSSIAQQALYEKLLEQQQDLIDSKVSILDENYDAIKKSAAGLLKSYLGTNAEELNKKVSTQEMSGFGSFVNTIQGRALLTQMLAPMMGSAGLVLAPILSSAMGVGAEVGAMISQTKQDGIDILNTILTSDKDNWKENAKEALEDTSISKRWDLEVERVNNVAKLFQADTYKNGEVGNVLTDMLSSPLSPFSPILETSNEIAEKVKAGSLGFDDVFGYATETASYLFSDSLFSANSRIAKKEQEQTEIELEAANHALVNFAVDMENSGDDLGSMLKTYNNLTENMDDLVLNSVEEQYGVLSVLSKATGKSEEAADALGKLSKAGLMTEESMLQLVDGLSSVNTDNSEVATGLNAYSTIIKGTSNDGKKSTNLNLTTLALKLGLDPDASVNEIKEAFISQNAKFGEDGNIQYDKNGNIKMRGNNAKNTAVYNALTELSTTMGDYADYTKDQLKVLEDYKIELDVTTLTSNLLTGLESSLNLKGMSDEELKNLQNDTDFQTKASAQIMEQGYAMIEAATAETKDQIRIREEKDAELQNFYNEQVKEYGEDSEQAFAAMDKMNANNEELDVLQKSYNEALQKLTQATLDAAGYMTGVEGDEMLTRASSTREKINDLRGKIGEGDTLDAEDYAYIRSELAPQMHDLYEDFNLESFLEDLSAGNSNAFTVLDDLYNNQSKLTDLKYSRSIATFPAQIKKLEDEYAELIEEAETEEAKESLRETLALKKQALEDERDIQIAQRKATQKLNNEMLGLTKEELKLQNAKNILASIEESIGDNVVENYHKKIEAQKVLLEDLENSAKSKWDLLSKTLNDVAFEEGESFQSYIKIVNGKIILDDDWYNNLKSHQKDILDNWVDDMESVASETHDTYQEILDTVDSFYDDQINLQNELLDNYKAKLEDEQESLQNSLEKRREMYDKYFDALNNETEEESFEERRASLINAISSLSSATDTASLEQLKEYQQELKDLESERLQTERDARRESVTNALDNQSEQIDQYYEARLENEQKLWEEITAMGADGINSLMTTYNEEYKNATDLNKTYMTLSFKEVYRDVMAMMGNTDAAAAAQKDYDNYLKYMELFSKDSSIGPYNKAKAYSSGGIVDYTGLAMVHGSSSKPEAFLNASQTALFSKLAQSLDAIYSQTSFNSDQNTSSENITIENLTISVDATLTDNNVQQTGDSLANALLEGLRRTGLSVNMKK